MNYKRHHIPERTCVSCREKRPKSEFIRVACTPEGKIEVDTQDAIKGRGAYVCRTKECWELALAGGRKDRLAHALRTGITPENRAVLAEYGKWFPSAEAVAMRN